MGFEFVAQASEEERHLNEVTTLLIHQDKLYSGADDGKIKVWSLDIKLIKEIDAHPINVYCLAANEDTLYSCSNDGTVKAWDLETYELKKTLLELPNSEIMRLFYCDGKLYAGDDKGNVYVWENDEQVGKYNVGEEVWGLIVHENYLFTVRNIDVSIIEMKPGGKLYTHICTISGRSPMVKVGDYFCFSNREGKLLNIHEVTKSSNFKALANIKAHAMMINAIAGAGNILFSGGYDREIKRWDVNTKKIAGRVDVPTVVNAIAALDPMNCYVAGEAGYLTQIKFN